MTRGLTLVELVITISLAAILGVPAGILLSEQLKGALYGRDYTVAMSLARREAEQLDSLNNFCHADLNLATTGPAPIPGFPAYSLVRVVQCQTSSSSCVCSCTLRRGPLDCRDATTATNDVKRIEVRVRKSGSSDNVASLVTYRTRWISFGQ